MNDPFEKIRNNKKSLLALFIRLAKADQNVDDTEHFFIENMRQRLGIDEAEMKEIWSSSEDFEFDPPQLEKHRMTILYQILYLTKIDGVVTKEEEEFVRQIGFKLGIHPNLTEELIGVIKKYLDQDLPTEELLGRVKKYMN
ncbi:hypothetical protein KFE98_13135 [bacterium SCSIO 12741]|nr:hypothetical protein KFE98_13135 [bacterium SCSIO 12741]